MQQVRKLVVWARPHEILIPRKALQGLTLPQGIGVFSAPEELEKRLGFSCAILRDFRSAMPIE